MNFYKIFFEVEGLKVDKDKLFDIFREHGMLIRRNKSTYKTTDFCHRFNKYKNLAKDMAVPAPNQAAWVSDISYIQTINGI